MRSPATVKLFLLASARGISVTTTSAWQFWVLARADCNLPFMQNLFTLSGPSLTCTVGKLPLGFQVSIFWLRSLGERQKLRSLCSCVWGAWHHGVIWYSIGMLYCKWIDARWCTDAHGIEPQTNMKCIMLSSLSNNHCSAWFCLRSHSYHHAPSTVRWNLANGRKLWHLPEAQHKGHDGHVDCDSWWLMRSQHTTTPDPAPLCPTVMFLNTFKFTLLVTKASFYELGTGGSSMFPRHGCKIPCRCLSNACWTSMGST